MQDRLATMSWQAIFIIKRLNPSIYFYSIKLNYALLASACCLVVFLQKREIDAHNIRAMNIDPV